MQQNCRIFPPENDTATSPFQCSYHSRIRFCDITIFASSGKLCICAKSSAECLYFVFRSLLGLSQPQDVAVPSCSFLLETEISLPQSQLHFQIILRLCVRPFCSTTVNLPNRIPVKSLNLCGNLVPPTLLRRADLSNRHSTCAHQYFRFALGSHHKFLFRRSIAAL